MIYHKYIKGEREQYGNYIYRDDECRCGCVRRSVLNNDDKEVVESYTVNDEVHFTEPECTVKKRTIFKTKRRYV